MCFLSSTLSLSGFKKFFASLRCVCVCWEEEREEDEEEQEGEEEGHGEFFSQIARGEMNTTVGGVTPSEFLD